LEQCTDAELRSAYYAELTATTEEFACFVGLCLEEARGRGLDTSEWPSLTVTIPTIAEVPASPNVERKLPHWEIVRTVMARFRLRRLAR
jgi:hypothetical protein